MNDKPGTLRRIQNLLIGRPRSPADRQVFHKISLIAFFAWVGLGVDGLSSSCYGPQEAFGILHDHMALGLFVAAATAVTVFTISFSYSQIVELFPTGGGGYLVASKLLSPSLGMVSGCALLIDYVLTIAVSVSSGADAIFSFLPPQWHHLKLHLAVGGVLVLTAMNLRGVRESVIPLIPIFVVFVVMHTAAILYAIGVKAGDIANVARSTADQIGDARIQLGLWGMVFLIARAYAMGAGTFTGIEAVSNGLPILREPRVQTARRTMRYMAVSLAFTAGGLMVAYCLHSARATQTQTANAVLLKTLTGGWGQVGQGVLLVTLVSEAAILLVAAQTGFIDGPRVLSNMALDRWMPSKFALLSDRLVAAHGIVLMGAAALAVVVLARARVQFLVVLYSINVFITFALSQLGMVRHWCSADGKLARRWLGKLTINGLGLSLTVLILLTVTVVKFHEGGWLTLLITGGLAVLAVLIRRHYQRTFAVLRRLDGLVSLAEAEKPAAPVPEPRMKPDGRTAVILVNGFNGLGLHSLLAVIRLFGKAFDNFAFVQVGLVDAGNFKGVGDVDELRRHVQSEVRKYVDYMKRNGYYAEGFSAIGVDVVDEVGELALQIRRRFPNLICFGGQLVFQQESFINRLLHNYIVFAVQRRLYREGIPFVVMPVRV